MYGIFNFRTNQFEYPDAFFSSDAAYIMLESLGSPVELAVVARCPFHEDQAEEDCYDCYIDEELIGAYRDE